MADVVQAAAPAAPQQSANPAESNLNSQENSEISGEEQELDAGSEESQEDSQEEQEASSEKDKKAKKKAEKAVEKRLKKLKLKVDGKELEEEIDLDDDESLTRHLQMAKMGQKRAQEKAELEKEVAAFMKMLGEDPFAAISQLGLKPDQIIDDYINKQLEQAKKTPEQIEKERLENELKAIRAEREREKQELQQKELARLQEQAFQQYDMQLEQALNKSDLPKTPYTVKKMADYMLVALEAGYDVTPEDVAGIVREEMHNDLKEMFGALPEDTIEALLGEQVLNKLRKRRVAKAQAAQQAVAKPQIQDTGKSAKIEATPKDKKSFRDFFGV